MNQEISLAKAKFYLTELRLQTEAVTPVTKEYKAPWLKEKGTIIRDQTGKFASGVSKAVKSAQEAAPVLGEAVDLGVKTIQSLLKDSGFRDRAGLAISLPMAKMISQLEKKAGVNPEFTKQLDRWIDSVTKEIADQYGDDKDPMAQAIRKANIAKPPADASLKEKLEFHVAQYTAYKEALEKPEQYKKPVAETIDLTGKAVKSLVPIGISLAFALLPEVGIPLVTMLAGGSAVLDWATILTSVVVGEALDAAVQVGLDKLEVDNMAVRIGVGVLAGILSGSLVTGVFLKVKNAKQIAKATADRLAAKEQAKKLAEEVELLEKEEIKRLIQQKEIEKLAKEKNEQLAEEEFEKLSEKEFEQLIKKNGQYDLVQKWKDPNTNLQDIIEDSNEGLSGNGRSPFRFLETKQSIPDYPSLSSKDKLSEISQEEIMAIKNYTATDAEYLNKYLRDDLTEHDISFMPKKFDKEGIAFKKLIKSISSGLNKLPRFKPKEPIVRYEGNYSKAIAEEMLPGSIFTTKSFMSTTPSPKGTANGYADGAASVKYIIHPHKESLARDITQFNAQGETECLYLPGTKFRVVKKYNQKLSQSNSDTKKYLDTLIIELEEYSAT